MLTSINCITNNNMYKLVRTSDNMNWIRRASVLNRGQQEKKVTVLYIVSSLKNVPVENRKDEIPIQKCTVEKKELYCFIHGNQFS